MSGSQITLHKVSLGEEEDSDDEEEIARGGMKPLDLSSPFICCPP